jgi:hypothetical protein
MNTIVHLIRLLLLRPLRNTARGWAATAVRIPRFLREYRTFRRGAELPVRVADWNPQLRDATRVTPFDPHYFYQSAWAAAMIAERRPERHVDVGSQINLIAPLTAIVPVEFVDIRPLEARLPRLTSVGASILTLPYPDRSIASLSSLHVVEHIGLGRYGDPIDPDGTRKACGELVRVLAAGGHLYLTVPVGRERVEFNAHRVLDPGTILRYCAGLVLADFSCVDDGGEYRRNVDVGVARDFSYGAGFFHFVRPAQS